MILARLGLDPLLRPQELLPQTCSAACLIFPGQGIHHVRMVLHVVGDGDTRVGHLPDLRPAHVTRLIVVMGLRVDEHGEGKAIFLQQRECRVIDRDVAVVESDGHSLVRHLLACLECSQQFRQRHDMEAVVPQMIQVLAKPGRRHAGGGWRGLGDVVIQDNGGVLRGLGAARPQQQSCHGEHRKLHGVPLVA